MTKPPAMPELIRMGYEESGDNPDDWRWQLAHEAERLAALQSAQPAEVSDAAVDLVGNELARQHAVYLTRESVRDLLARACLALSPARQATPEPVTLGPLAKRNIFDAIRGAYDLGYNDARNARTVPGDSAPGYKGRDVEEDHGGALFSTLSRRLTAPAGTQGFARTTTEAWPSGLPPALTPDTRSADGSASKGKEMSNHNEAMSQLPHKLATLIKCLPQAPFRDHLATECIKQAERIAELEARVHTCGPTCSKAGCINRRLTSERDTLRAEVERLRVDAERYQWLRDVSVPPHNFYVGVPVEFDGVKYAPHEVDAYIDTARKATQ